MNVVLASPLEAELVERVKDVDRRLNVVWRPDLLGTPRYPGDHFPPIQRTPEQSAEWARILADAEVLLDVDPPSAARIVDLAPKLRWIQSSSSGVGDWIRRLKLTDTSITVTNAAGIHATPLAEFALFAMLYFAKHWPRMAREQRAHHWERCAIDTLVGKCVGIIGLGHVGSAVATLARGMGMRVIAFRRGAQAPNVDGVSLAADLGALLRAADYLVLSVAHTSETHGMLGAAELALLKPGAVLINIARGTIVDEAALIDALVGGRLAGAALDVFAHEPLPPDSPLWDMPNVLVTPHSMSTARDENTRLTDLFCDNLRRFLANEPLRNVVDKMRGY